MNFIYMENMYMNAYDFYGLYIFRAYVLYT